MITATTKNDMSVSNFIILIKIQKKKFQITLKCITQISNNYEKNNTNIKIYA